MNRGVPIPPKLVNDSTIEAIDVPQMRATSTITVMPTSTDNTAMSKGSRRLRRPRRTGLVRGAVASTVGTGGATTRPTSGNGSGEDALLLILDAHAKGVNVRGAVLVDEALERLDDHRLGEVRPGVAVQVLRNVLGLGGQVDSGLLQCAVAAGVRAGVDRDVGRVALEVGVLRAGGAEELEQILAAGWVLGLRGQHEPVDRRLHRVDAVGRVDRREREDDHVVELVLRRLQGDVRQAEHDEADLLLGEGRAALLPGTAERAGLVVVEKAGPQLEDVLDLVAGPRLLAGHQVDVELVPVGPHVQVVEGAHRRPAVLVGEAERGGDPVLLHLLHERDELVPRTRRLVALRVEGALPVEHRPGVVVERHEVLLAVRACRRALEPLAEAGQPRPDIADVREEALLREELHAETGEPGGHVIRVGLQVPGDVRLVVVVRHGIDLDRVARLLLVGIHRVLDALLGLRVRVVGPEADGLLGATTTARAATAAATRREQSGQGDHTCANGRTTKHRASRKLARGEQGLRHYPSYVLKEWRVGWGIPTQPFKTHHSPAPESSDVKGLGPLRFKSVT